MILVTGATGNVGAAVVRALVAAGEEVRVLVRDPAEGALPAGVTTAVGDLDRPETLSGAVAGVRGVFLLPGYADMPGVLAEMRRADVEHVVLLSSGAAADGDMGNAITRYMIVSEAAVRESGRAWTILRSSGFMSNALRWLAQLRAGDVVHAPFARVRIAAIDPFDIAAVATAAFSARAHRGRTYRLTGPESLLPSEQVRVLGAVLGRDLRFIAQSDAEARAEMSRAMPAEYVDAFFSYFADGTYDDSAVLPTVEELTGRTPRKFEQWALAHADAFR